MSKYLSLDGNTAAAYVGYAMSDICYIYPITPSSSMCEVVDEWSTQEKKNIFGNIVPISQMQSEGGVSGAVHGAVIGGQLVSTFTCAQGLLLMIPELFKMAGELQPVVLHVSTRSISGQGMTIYSDHSDVMACRQTGWAMMSSDSCQEVLDLGAISHMSTIKARIPFMHFFDGFRVSHEQMKVHQLPYDQIGSVYDYEALKQWRESDAVMSTEHPTMRGLVQNADVYFQLQEATNPMYERLPEIVQEMMDRYATISGRQYHLFDYTGAPDAEDVLIMMGAGAPPAGECVEYLNAQGAKVGLVRVRLFRPFSGRHLVEAIPATARRITVLDRTKEPGSAGEPLYLDVLAAFDQFQPDRQVTFLRGRYGLGGRDFTPTLCKAVFDNMRAASPRRLFTIGVNDDQTHLNLIPKEPVVLEIPGLRQSIFWGFGADGTVGSCKNSIAIIGDNTQLYSQGFFVYDAKKSGGVTVSHLRFGPQPITSQYEITDADYTACHAPSYVDKYDMLSTARPESIFVLNTPVTLEEVDRLPAKLRKQIAEKNLRFYIIDANAIATQAGLRGRINMVMQVVFFQLAQVIPVEDAIGYLKNAIRKLYSRKGESVVQKNFECVDNTLAHLQQVTYDRAAWMGAEEQVASAHPNGFMHEVGNPCGKMVGAQLPITTLEPYKGGVMPTATTQYEKRGVATLIPKWDADKCIECNLCSLACAHAAIRPFVLTPEESEGLVTKPLTGVPKELGEQYRYRIQVAPDDCLGCMACAIVCPRKALTMAPSEKDDLMVRERENWSRLVQVPSRGELFAPTNIRNSQFQQPLLEFSGACAGCCETQMAKLITQLYGERMYIANACGCSMVWGGTAVTCPYTVNAEGHGPCYTGTLFEDAAEVGYGMSSAIMIRRDQLRHKVRALLSSGDAELAENVRAALQEWNEQYSQAEGSKRAGMAIKRLLAPASQRSSHPLLQQIYSERDLFTKKSFWIFGGDGWAYDIGFGGLDHVLSLGADVNVLVMDTEVYSNTGGQKSKSTPRSAVARFAAGGKREGKKDLGFYALTLGNVYVASCAMGANKQQTLRAIQEAEAYPGTSLILCYCPCIAHGLSQGMGMANEEQKLAVQSGYWNLYRYDPRRADAGQNPLQIDSNLRPPNAEAKLEELLSHEVRFATLKTNKPEQAAVLQAGLARDLEERRNRLLRLSESFKAAE
eukprot:gnl/Trimastix_PCT/617.p1 GENE.gnl/Trimastix_PCT/617~~gnl/Trimastix_PCT/617.p1  ORF type:complete len:1187 (-),score=470.04 gnl/Trimastix_PCT/617:195-3755(-)